MLVADCCHCVHCQINHALYDQETHLARNEKLGGGKLTAKEAKAMVSAVLDNQAHPIVYAALPFHAGCLVPDETCPPVRTTKCDC